MKSAAEKRNGDGEKEEGEKEEGEKEEGEKEEGDDVLDTAAPLSLSSMSPQHHGGDNAKEHPKRQCTFRHVLR